MNDQGQQQDQGGEKGGQRRQEEQQGHQRKDGGVLNFWIRNLWWFAALYFFDIFE